MNYILIPGYNRPEFFSQVMKSLVKNLEIKDYGILFTLEQDVNPRYFQIIESFKDGLRMETIQWPEHYGLTKSILEGLKIAMEKSQDYVIILEDDVVVSADFLRFLDHCYHQFYPINVHVPTTNDIAAIGSTTNRVIGRVDWVYKEQWYLPWGVLIPKDFFNDYLLKHCNEAYYQNSKEYADKYYLTESIGKEVAPANLILRIMLKNNLYQILPEVPRSLEIGTYGTHRHGTREVYSGQIKVSVS